MIDSMVILFMVVSVSLLSLIHMSTMEVATTSRGTPFLSAFYSRAPLALANTARSKRGAINMPSVSRMNLFATTISTSSNSSLSTLNSSLVLPQSRVVNPRRAHSLIQLIKQGGQIRRSDRDCRYY